MRTARFSKANPDSASSVTLCTSGSSSTTSSFQCPRALSGGGCTSSSSRNSIRSSTSGTAGAMGSGIDVLRGWLHRKIDYESGTRTGLAGHLDRAPQALGDQGVHDVQPEPGTAGGPCGGE